ncbi:uncharacterized protein LOC123722712 [Papilio machaon]|uniref:uncharacterized protein LOC123722712 n=1 Tax=Papilio machaon TaxID=76193 RepID=UPI001E6643ED|nr:uncharacterized protein LOC123722712 [Papilio machaon]
MKWKELTNKLNSDGTGDPRSEEKWRKVWSDYKNNTKKKCAKMNRGASGTGGGPALQLSLTDLENRVMQIIGVQAATGMVIEEAGFQRGVATEVDTPSIQPDKSVPEVSSEFYIEGILSHFYKLPYWITPGTSKEPTVAPPSMLSPPAPTEAHPTSPPNAPVEEEWKPPPQKKFKNNNEVIKMLIKGDMQSREYAKERDRVYEETEKERLRLKNEHPSTDQLLFVIVTTNMIHGPCGTLNSSSPCMADGKCTKNYPKDFTNDTVTNVDGYSIYRRRNPENGGQSFIKNIINTDIDIDNRWVAPYSPLLSKTYNAHINIEFCSSVKSIKYICKYVHKGSDMAVFRMENTNVNAPPVNKNDEITLYQISRYISSNEAAWRIFGFPIHHTSSSSDADPQTYQFLLFSFDLPPFSNRRLNKTSK